MTNMAKPSPNLYTTEISLVLTIVFFVNSALLFFDHFLSSFLAMSAALASATFCYIAFTHFAKPSESFESIFWSSFSLMSAHLSNAGDTISWDLHRARLFIAIGCTILALYTMFIWFRQDQVPEKPGVPLLVEVSFHFIGNGIAMAGRLFLQVEALPEILVGSAVMLCVSAVCFCKYCKAESVSFRNQSQQLHLE